jgi:hypothetical protein
MADNVTANAGTGGATFATDDVGGVQHTRVKVEFGADGTAADVHAANPLPVQVGDGASHTLPAGDAAARSIFVRPTDGTNSMPAMDAAGRAGFVKVTDGTNTMPTGDAAARALFCTAIGDVAAGSADSGNPVKVGAKAVNALPTAVSNGQRANLIADLFGRLLVGSIDPAQQIWKAATYSTQQTGAALWTPAAGKKIAITHLHVTTGGTTSGRVTAWFGAGGGSPDTTYTEGTDQPVFDGEFAPNANGLPGALVQLPVPIFCANADYVLRVTTSAGITVHVVAYGYEF